MSSLLESNRKECIDTMTVLCKAYNFTNHVHHTFPCTIESPYIHLIEGPEGHFLQNGQSGVRLTLKYEYQFAGLE